MPKLDRIVHREKITNIKYYVMYRIEIDAGFLIKIPNISTQMSFSNSKFILNDMRVVDT